MTTSFLSDGIYASNGNLEFDRALLAFELDLVAVATHRLISLSARKNKTRFHGS